MRCVAAINKVRRERAGQPCGHVSTAPRERSVWQRRAAGRACPAPAFCLRRSGCLPARRSCRSRGLARCAREEAPRSPSALMYRQGLLPATLALARACASTACCLFLASLPQMNRGEVDEAELKERQVGPFRQKSHASGRGLAISQAAQQQRSSRQPARAAQPLPSPRCCTPPDATSATLPRHLPHAGAWHGRSGGAEHSERPHHAPGGGGACGQVERGSCGGRLHRLGPAGRRLAGSEWQPGTRRRAAPPHHRTAVPCPPCTGAARHAGGSCSSMNSTSHPC